MVARTLFVHIYSSCVVLSFVLIDLVRNGKVFRQFSMQPEQKFCRVVNSILCHLMMEVFRLENRQPKTFLFFFNFFRRFYVRNFFERYSHKIRNNRPAISFISYHIEYVCICGQMLRMNQMKWRITMRTRDELQSLKKGGREMVLPISAFFALHDELKTSIGWYPLNSEMKLAI